MPFANGTDATIGRPFVDAIDLNGRDGQLRLSWRGLGNLHHPGAILLDRSDHHLHGLDSGSRDDLLVRGDSQGRISGECVFISAAGHRPGESERAYGSGISNGDGEQGTCAEYTDWCG
jgi:hypothetical protein